MSLFSGCFDICYAQESSLTINNLNNRNLLSDNKNSTKKHSNNNKKRDNLNNSKGKHHHHHHHKKNTNSSKTKCDMNKTHNNHNNHTHNKNKISNTTTTAATTSNTQKISYLNNNHTDQDNTMNNKKEESTALVDEQWNVCNYVNNKNIVLDKVQMMHTVSIFNCENSTIMINNEKFKSIQINNCNKCNIVLKNLISAIEMIDSKKLKIQVTGRCSSITIDKCIGIEIYLSKENEETEFTTALSADMIIHKEPLNPDDDWKEITIPEQYQHVLDKEDLSTRVSDLYKF